MVTCGEGKVVWEEITDQRRHGADCEKENEACGRYVTGTRGLFQETADLFQVLSCFLVLCETECCCGKDE